MTRPRTRGFTLIELLVVIAIIAILAAILFPVFAQAKVAAKKASAISAGKQLILGVTMYADSNDDIVMPRRRIYNGPPSGPDPSNGLTWEFFAHPYVKASALFDLAEDTGKRYDSPLGKYRRSWVVAPNAFLGWQERTTRPLKTSKGTGWFPDPAKTVALLPSPLLDAVSTTDQWKKFEWVLGSEIQTSRKFPLADACPFKKESWVYAQGGIANLYSNGAVYAFMDGHAAYKAVNGAHAGKHSACETTRFDGYEEKAAAWDKNAASFPEWTKGLSCFDAGAKDAGSDYCKVPGE